MPPSIPADFDWQGHRGARGLLPENTVPAFLEALKYPVTTLELDVAVSKDTQIIVSHEPWFSSQISTTPAGVAVTKEQEKDLLIYQMTAEEVARYDVGSRGNPRFKQQQKMRIHKPALREVVQAVNDFCKKNNHPQPRYNIEIKSRPEWDGKLSPPPAEFVRILLNEINELGIDDQTCVQSFDIRTLMALNDQDSKITNAYLIENMHSFEKNMAKLDFQPDIYSPYFQLVTQKLAEAVHQKGMKLIPWTVNETEDMKRLIAAGVDGIITDYPNLIEEVKK